MTDLSDLAKGLSEKRKAAILDSGNPFGLTAFGDPMGGWHESVKPQISAALYRLGLLERMRDRANPIHEPVRHYWLYRKTVRGLALQSYLRSKER